MQSGRRLRLMASPQGHLACPTTQPVHHLASQQDMASQPDSEAQQSPVSAEQQSGASLAPPAVALLDLPSPLLVRISAYLEERDLHNFTRACTTTQRLLRDNTPLYAACRALGFKTSRAPRLSASLTQRVYRPLGRPQRVDAHGVALSVHPGLTPGEVLCRTQLAEWVLWCAGLAGAERVMGSVLGMSNPTMAEILRCTNFNKYDRAWAVAAGAAAAGPSPSLFHALCAMPCAPGQPRGMRRAYQEFQTTLLFFAVTGPDPDTALDMVMPLCWLPYQDPSKAGVATTPLHDDDDVEMRDPHIVAQERKINAALRDAAVHALRYGYTAALVPLSRRGAAMAEVFTAFERECETRAHGAALQALLDTAYPSTNNRPLKDTISHPTLTRAWDRAMCKPRIPCILALMGSCGDRLRDTIRRVPHTLAGTCKHADIPVLRAVLDHIVSDTRYPYARESNVLIGAIQHGMLQTVEMLLQYGWAPNSACIEAAALSPRKHAVTPKKLRVLLDAAAARGAEYLASEVPQGSVIEVMCLHAREYDRCGWEAGCREFASVLLEHLLERPGLHPCFMRLRAGHEGDESDAADAEAQGAPAVSTHGLWDETHPDGDEWGTLLIETLLILNETRVVEAVLRMAKNYKVDKTLLERFARHCAGLPGRGPPHILTLLHNQGVTVPHLISALLKSNAPSHSKS